jgi:hypothetical protein
MWSHPALKNGEMKKRIPWRRLAEQPQAVAGIVAVFVVELHQFLKFSSFNNGKSTDSVFKPHFVCTVHSCQLARLPITL